MYAKSEHTVLVHQICMPHSEHTVLVHQICMPHSEHTVLVYQICMRNPSIQFSYTRYVCELRAYSSRTPDMYAAFRAYSSRVPDMYANSEHTVLVHQICMLRSNGSNLQPRNGPTPKEKPLPLPGEALCEKKGKPAD